MKPFVLFNGIKYSEDKSNGYFRSHGPYKKRKNPKTYLHRDIWIYNKGPIPDGYEIHHKDEDKSHNDISNYECLSHSTHQFLYSPVRKDVSVKACETCGNSMPRRSVSGYLAIPPSMYARKRFCSILCAAAGNRGRSNRRRLTAQDKVDIVSFCVNETARQVIASFYGISLGMVQLVRRRGISQ